MGVSDLDWGVSTSFDGLAGDDGRLAAGEEPAGGGGGEWCADGDHGEVGDAGSG